MPSNFFRGGLDAINNNANPWNSAANLKASPVAGQGIVSTGRHWQTLDDFLQSNTLVGAEAAIPATPNRGTSWSAPAFATQFWFNDPISFGVIGAGQEVAGLVFYDGSSADPANAVLWFASENSGGFFTGDGGVVSAGTSGQNIAAHWQSLVVSNRYSFQGTVDHYITQANAWGDAGWRLGYALIRSTTTGTPSREWRLMSDVPASIQYCTGAEPGNANMPETPSTGREGPEIALNTDGDWYEWGLHATTTTRPAITWSAGNLTPGEVVVAVIVFAFQGVYSPGSAWVLHWDDVADHTIEVSQDVTYGQTTKFSVNRMLI